MANGGCHLSWRERCPVFSIPARVKPAGSISGCGPFWTTDDGTAFASPGFLFDELDTLKRRSRKLSARGRKTIGSGSWKREQLSVSRLHAKITNRRDDFHWKLAHELCQRYDMLCFEDLNLVSMKKQFTSRKARRKFGDLALGQLSPKTRMGGKENRTGDPLCVSLPPVQQNLQPLRA